MCWIGSVVVPDPRPFYARSTPDFARRAARTPRRCRDGRVFTGGHVARKRRASSALRLSPPRGRVGLRTGGHGFESRHSMAQVVTPVDRSMRERSQAMGRPPLDAPNIPPASDGKSPQLVLLQGVTGPFRDPASIGRGSGVDRGGCLVRTSTCAGTDRSLRPARVRARKRETP